MKMILVVDDERTLRLNLCEMLAFEGFNAIEAENGAVAIQLARAHQPDVIICDVAMPEMDGFEVLRLLKQDIETAQIPVLLLTARAEKASMQYGLEMGAKDYLLKPFVFYDVLTKVRACLGE